MAIQNFVAGGFYGKLGQLVGQRWKNKRIIRTYTVPANPRTPAQQANRAVFAQCTRASQIAMQMNFNAPAWDSSVTPEWGQRVRRATILMKETQRPLNQIPLFPNDTSATYTISTITKVGQEGTSDMKFSVTGTLPAVNRNVSVLVGYWNATTEAYDLELFQSELVIDETPYFVLSDAVGRTFDETTVFLICSNDDKDHTAEALFCPQTPLEAVETDWNNTILDVTRNGNVFTIRFAESSFTPTASNVSAEIYCVSRGQWVTRTVSLAMSGDGTNLVGTFTQEITEKNSEIFAFPNGSLITVSGTVTKGGSVLNPTTTASQAFESTDLTREWDNTVTLSSVTETNIVLSLADKVQYGGDTYTISALVGGDFVGARTQSDWNANAVFSTSQNVLNVAKPDTGSISVFQLNASSTITLANSVVSQGVTYEPKIKTAQAIPYSNDKLTVNLFPTTTYTMQSGGKWIKQQLGVTHGSKASSRNTWYTAMNNAINANWELSVYAENGTQAQGDSTSIDDYLDPYSGTGSSGYVGAWLTASSYGQWTNQAGDDFEMSFSFDSGSRANITVTVGQARFVLTASGLTSNDYSTGLASWIVNQGLAFHAS